MDSYPHEEQRQRSLHFLTETRLNEMIYLSKRSRAGFLGAVTRVRTQIEALLTDTNNEQTVQVLNERYQKAWQKFEDSHNSYMSLLNPDSAAFRQAVEQFNQLHDEKSTLSQRVIVYLHNYSVSNRYISEMSSKDHVESEHAYAQSLTSHRSSVSRTSQLSSRSSAKEKRIQAAKANLALRLAEQEQRHVIEGELRLHEIEKKQRELAREQKFEEEELERSRRLETLKQETDRKLAGVRERAALTTLEAQLEEKIDDHEIIDMDLVSEDEEPQTGDIPSTYLYEDEIPPPYVEDSSIYESFQRNTAYPIFAPSEINVASTADINARNRKGYAEKIVPEFSTDQIIPTRSWVSPAYSHPEQEEFMTNAQNPNYFTPRHRTLAHQPLVYSQRFKMPSVVYPVSKIPSPTGSLSDIPSYQDLKSVAKKPAERRSRTNLKISQPGHKPSVDRKEPQVYKPVNSTLHRNSDALNTVTSAMENITLVQQRLASSLNLPTIQLDKFSGLPSEFPIFKQRFEKRIMTRDGFDDGEKMLRLLQFLDGEAKEAVKSYEAVEGGVYKAMKILEQRYGRKCLIVSSIVDSLTKGPAIPIRDRIALRKFADNAASAEATLKSLDCLNEVNQGNLVEMSHRLPRHLQEKFATLAHDLESKEERFPTLSDFASFLDKWATVANHPVNVGNVQVPTKDKGDSTLKHGTFATGLLRNGKVDSNKDSQTEPCPCCSLTHSIYSCELFKKKTQPERFELVKKKGLCYNCLKNNPIIRSGVKVKHIVKSCPSKFKCKIEGCGLSHHTLLHKPKSVEKKEDNVDEGNDIIPKADSNATTLETSDAILLQVIPVRLISQNEVATTTYAMLDSGSEISLVDPSLIEQLGIQGRSDKLVVSTVSNENDLQHGQRVNLALESLTDENPERLEIINAWCSKELKIPLRHQRVLHDKSKWNHLQDIPFPNVERKKISIIIGTNLPEAFIPLDVRYDGPESPVAIRSRLGYSIFGRVGNTTELQRYTANPSAVYNVCVTDEFTLNKQLESFWKIEHLGVTRECSAPFSVEDKRALKVIEETLTKVDGHYEIGLLWKDKEIHLPNNRAVAELRLQHLKRRLEQDAEIKQRYTAAINDYIIKGYAKQLTNAEESAKGHKTWYLPHHPVIHPHKPGKVRAVFDAASRYRNTSLNDQLLVGPDLMNNLVGILIRFRQDPIALIADIEAMFHQVKVKPEDCDALRFLWSDGDVEGPAVAFKMLVHIFRAKSSPCCANKALLQTANDNESKCGKDVADVVRRNFYVDDLLKSTTTIEKATDLALKLIDLLAQGGFRLTKFMSNRKEVLRKIPVGERATPALDLDLDKLPINRTLGLSWDAETDEFYFSSVKTDKPSTKRGIRC